MLGAVSWLSVMGLSSIGVGTVGDVLDVCMRGVVVVEDWEDPPSAGLGVHGMCG